MVAISLTFAAIWSEWPIAMSIKVPEKGKTLRD
jgi:hypothetical protein